MATSSISGLASGLDTSSIVSQLMQLEAIPQGRLKTRLSTEQSARTALQGLNTQVAALAEQAAALSKPDTWRTQRSTSSSADVAVSSTPNGAGGAGASVSLTVERVATAHRLSFSQAVRGTDPVLTEGTSVQLTLGGETTTLETGDGSLDGLVAALNGSGTGVRASRIRLDDGSHRLAVTSTSTGAAGAFSLTGPQGEPLLGGASVVAGVDAQVRIGDDLIHSASNTFADVVPGLSFTISSKAVGTTVDLETSPDPAAMTEKAKKLVDDLNAVLARIDGVTSTGGGTTSTRGVLAGDSTLRTLRQQLLDSVFPPGSGSLADVGIQTTRTGRLTFDATTFSAAYTADPTAVEQAFTGGGFASRVQLVSETASRSSTGTLSGAITGRGQAISQLEDRLQEWDVRLELRRSSLTRQYTALETALSQLNSQSNWLTSQLASTNQQS